MSKKRTPSLHPACKLFPLLGGNELRELADDISENGLQNAIVLLDGKVLDGQNRLAACKLAGVEPTFVEWKGIGSPLYWVVSQNLMRRHLSASQRAVVALELLPMLEKEAKERQRMSPGRGKKGSEKFAESEASGKASEIAAKLVGANSRYIEIIKQVNLKAPDLINEIKVGRISVTEANWVADLPTKDRKSLMSEINGDGLTDEIIRQWKSDRNAKVKKPQTSAIQRVGSAELILGDCRTKLKEIPSNSVDAIISDPIYPEVNREYGRITESEWLALMSEVVAESKRVLKPKGSAVFILQPNYDKVGKMRLWLWRFLIQAAEEWNLVQDCYPHSQPNPPRHRQKTENGEGQRSLPGDPWLSTWSRLDIATIGRNGHHFGWTHARSVRRGRRFQGVLG